MKKVERVFELLEDVKYGFWIDKEKRPATESEQTEDFIFKNCSIAVNQKILLERKIGTCIDTGIFIYRYLSKFYPITFLHVESGTETHSTNIVFIDDYWYWVEKDFEKNYNPKIIKLYSDKEQSINELFETWRNNREVTYRNKHVCIEKIFVFNTLSMISYLQLCKSPLVD